jgi:hypothetical protein
VSVSKVLRKIFRNRRDKMIGGRRKLYNGEFYNQRKRNGQGTHSTCRRWLIRTKFYFARLKEKDYSEDLGVDGSIILKQNLGNRLGGYGLYSSEPEQGSVVCPCEHRNKPSGCHRGKRIS